MMFRTLIKGKEGNVILEITDTTGSHQFPAMRRLSVVRGGQWSAGHSDIVVILPAITTFTTLTLHIAYYTLHIACDLS